MKFYRIETGEGLSGVNDNPNVYGHGVMGLNLAEKLKPFLKKQGLT